MKDNKTGTGADCRTDNQEQKQKRKINSKQVVAIAGVIGLAGMYIVTLVVAIVDHTAAGSMFQGCILATAAIPALIWFYMWMYGKMTGRKTMADFDKTE